MAFFKGYHILALEFPLNCIFGCQIFLVIYYSESKKTPLEWSREFFYLKISRKENVLYSLWAVPSKRKEKWGTLKGALVNLIATSVFSSQNIGGLEIETEAIDYIIPLISLSRTWSECRLYDELWVSYWTINQQMKSQRSIQKGT